MQILLLIYVKLNFLDNILLQMDKKELRIHPVSK